MKKTTFAILLALFVMVTATSADTLHLRSGANIEGTFLGADTRQTKFLGPDGQPKTYSLTEVEGITFAALSAPAAAASKAPAPAAAPPAAPTRVIVPAGTLIFVRMLDSLDTSKTQTGQFFTATLDTNLTANVLLLPKKGTKVNGKVIKTENARRLTGKSELQLELTNIIIDGTAHPIMTSGFQSKGGSEGKKTLKKTADGAGLGAAIGAVSGVGVSMIKKGEPIRIPSESLLEFTLKQPTTLPVSKT
jgi:hypothetical protein